MAGNPSRSVARTVAPIDISASAVRGLVRLSRTVERVASREQLSVSQYRILDRLASGSTRGRGLAEWLAVKPPSITSLVDGLVRRGLVARTEDGSDRRQVTHSLTSDGAALRQAVSAEIGERLREFLIDVEGLAALRMVEALAAWDDAIDTSLARKLAPVVGVSER
jgi:DNA-binding MarR family transcriptional regulator